MKHKPIPRTLSQAALKAVTGPLGAIPLVTPEELKKHPPLLSPEELFKNVTIRPETEKEKKKR